MGPLTIDPGLTVWTLITFVGLVLLLARFAFGPLTRAMQERERRIGEALEKAAEARREAEALVTRNEQQLDQAREETRRIINEGHRIVAEMKREARDSAHKDAEQIVAHARTDIEREVRRGLDDLKSTVAGLSLRIARQVIKKDLDEGVHAQLADDFIERLKKTHAGK